ncbi:hypothetical protein Sjap_011510 [Stephania japonica]|uniref:Uncharacterized protein n=1 Tax=Stephania japonica TaxID=461633 RepID=A0AAP0JBN1_9MAGN
MVKLVSVPVDPYGPLPSFACSLLYVSLFSFLFFFSPSYSPILYFLLLLCSLFSLFLLGNAENEGCLSGRNEICYKESFRRLGSLDSDAPPATLTLQQVFVQQRYSKEVGG